ncbi:hypothetical protein [Vulcanisaeta sp. JCM 14467]|nr:hypothetical protein [Vulcanisaeta sp. JCM 14467]
MRISRKVSLNIAVVSINLPRGVLEEVDKCVKLGEYVSLVGGRRIKPES